MTAADAPRHDRSSDLPAARPPVLPDGPVTVGALLRREGRAAHSQDRPVVPRARDVVADRGPAHRVAVTAGTILAVAAVLGTNVLGDVALGPGDDGERGFGGPVVPDPPNPLSLAATEAPVGHAMAVLRAAGSPVLAAMNDLSSGTSASGAGIVAQAFAGLPGSVSTAVGPLSVLPPSVLPGASTVSDDDGDGSADTSDTSDSSRTRASTSGSSGRSSEADDDTRRQTDRPSTTPRRGGGSGGTVTSPVRIPPVLSGPGPSGPGSSGSDGGTVAPPSTTPTAPAPPEPTGVTPDGGSDSPDGGTTPTPAAGGSGTDGGSGDTPTTDSPATDSPATDTPKTEAPDTGTPRTESASDGTTSARPDPSDSDGSGADDTDQDSTSAKDADSKDADSKDADTASTDGGSDSSS